MFSEPERPFSVSSQPAETPATMAEQVWSSPLLSRDKLEVVAPKQVGPPKSAPMLTQFLPLVPPGQHLGESHRTAIGEPPPDTEISGGDQSAASAGAPAGPTPLMDFLSTSGLFGTPKHPSPKAALPPHAAPPYRKSKSMDSGGTIDTGSSAFPRAPAALTASSGAACSAPSAVSAQAGTISTTAVWSVRPDLIGPAPWPSKPPPRAMQSGGGSTRLECGGQAPAVPVPGPDLPDGAGSFWSTDWSQSVPEKVYRTGSLGTRRERTRSSPQITRPNPN